MREHTQLLLEDAISVDIPPPDLKTAFEVLFTPEALNFVVELVTTFEGRANDLYWNRLRRKSEIQLTGKLPTFPNNPIREDRNWKVALVPPRLLNRRLDLGDVSPSNTQHFLKALASDVQGIQVDFDDGHCPTWRNQIIGLHNVYQVCHEQFYGLGRIHELPVLMLRPRAWNMTEHNILINGKAVPGALIDFAILVFHNGNILAQNGSGPFFYLSKIEGAAEARLWNDIFVWTQKRIGLPLGTIKACVLIENILSTFQMEEILYEMRDHSLGLNCGIWDYAASIICKFGNSSEFILPDRSKNVSMQVDFLKKYMQLLVQTCHARGAHATGGMAALLVPPEDSDTIIQRVIESKRFEIQNGVDGFMVYDTKLIPHMNELWQAQCGSKINQINLKLPHYHIDPEELLLMPTGGVTFTGLKHNIEVAVTLIYKWLNGEGHFFMKGSVEDSATAEISRQQVWQWIKHKAMVEGTNEVVTREMVRNLTASCVRKQMSEKWCTAADIFLEIVTLPYPPDFITTYLNDNHVFRHTHSVHNNILSLQAKL